MRAIAAASSGTPGLACTALPPGRRAASPATVDDGRPVPRPLLAPREGTPADRADLLRHVPFLYAPHAAILWRCRRERRGVSPRAAESYLLGGGIPLPAA